MQSSLKWIGPVAALLLSLSAQAADEKKADKKPAAEKDAKESKEKLVSLGKLVCQISRVEGAEKGFVVRVRVPVLQYAGRSVRVVLQNKDVEVEPTDEMIVRTKNPPQEFDEKGRLKKYTAKELKELKGPDPKLPGYKADFDSLKPDQVVMVYLAKRKDAAKGTPSAKSKPKKGKKKDEDEEKDEKETTTNKPLVTMVVILYEPPK